MPSKIQKILKKRRTRKIKTKNKKITKMKGGAAAAPAAPAAPAAAISCMDAADDKVIDFGFADTRFLSNAQYSSQSYSDHAPIIYNFANALPPLKNEYINIITWNVGQWGNYYDQKYNSYNHKFNMKRLESLDEYTQRLKNLVLGFEYLLNNNQLLKGNNHPFLFCQELPFVSNEPNSSILRDKFKNLLYEKSLGLLCDSSERNEFGMIVKLGSNSQRFTILNKTEYWDNAYSNKKLIFPHGLGDKEWRKFEIYFYNHMGNTYYYVNIHALYTEDPSIIVNFLNRIVDTIHVYHIKHGGSIDNVIIYIIGDYNFNIASPDLNILIHTKYNNDPLQLFENEHLKPKRKIKNMYKLTTENAAGYSLIDNIGSISSCNIDCILKLDLASA